MKRTATLTPQELAEACVKHMWDNDRASRSLGMRIRSVAPGASSVEMELRDDMANGHGTAHGAFIFALADSAFAFACNSHNRKTVGAFCQITYLRPAHVGNLLVADAVEVDLVGRSAVYDVTVSTGDEIVALFRGHSRSIEPTLID